MTGTMGYAQPLRVIGQALETLNLQSFELEPIGEDFFVRGSLIKSDVDLGHEAVSAATLKVIWGKFPAAAPKNQKEQNEGSATVVSPIELQYTNKDVERLEQEGQSRRIDSNRMPDSASLSQVMRCVGAYLNQKPARLVKLWRNPDSVSIEYETSLGSKLKETLVVGELYDLWVRMYMQRAERSGQ